MNGVDLIYLSGVHGAGKTTICKELMSRYDFELADRLDIKLSESTLGSPFRRAVFRMFKYYFESLEHRKLNPISGQRIVADRCVFDTLVYVDAYLQLGWISNAEKNKISDLFQTLFSISNLSWKIVYLAPPESWVAFRLAERWQVEAKGWREEDREYLSVVIECYHRFYQALSLNSLFPYHQIEILTLTKTNLPNNLVAISEFASRCSGIQPRANV